MIHEYKIRATKRNIKRTNKGLAKMIKDLLDNLTLSEDVRGVEVDLQDKNENLQMLDGIQYRKKKILLTIDFYEREEKENE